MATYNMDGSPAPVVSNSKGYVPPFQCDPGITAVNAAFGSVVLPLVDQSAILEAGEAAVAAQSAAEDAAALVGAPADLAIAAAVQALGTQTRQALEVLFGDTATAALVNIDGTATRTAVNAILDAYKKTLIPAGQTVYDTDWVNCTINPGFASQGAPKPQVRRIGMDVKMRWGISNTGLSAKAAFNVIQLPPGFASPQEVHIPVASSSASQMGSASIQPTGNVMLKTNTSLGAYYLFNSCRWSL